MGFSASASIDKKGNHRKHRLHRYRMCKCSFPRSNLKLDRMQQENQCGRTGSNTDNLGSGSSCPSLPRRPSLLIPRRAKDLDPHLPRLGSLVSLTKGESITLPGFGTFEVRDWSERSGRNHKTGEELKIAAAKVPVFKPDAALKAGVNGK